MRYIFKFPDIGEGLDEGTLAEWYVKKGQNVAVGDPLCKMETDKVVTDIPSPKVGVVAAIYGKIGEVVKVGDPLVEIEIDGTDVSDVQETTLVEEEGAGVVGTLEIAGNNAFLPASGEGFSDDEQSDSKEMRKVLATPVARAMAKDYGIDIQNIIGTGPAGRVMKEDIEKFRTSAPKKDHTIVISKSDLVEIKPLSQLRKTIAKNMITSKHNAAHMTLFDEVEIGKLVEFRSSQKEKLAQEGIKLSYLPFVIKGVALALKKFPALNTQMDLENSQMIYKKYYNIGIAVDTEDGLVVPVIKDADKLSITELATELQIISEKARSKSLTLEDMKDGTFTITSFGSIGGSFAVPVINYPQAAILGIGRIQKKPVVKDDVVVPGEILPLSISVDHRIVDGGEVSRFMNKIMEYFNDPLQLLMD